MRWESALYASTTFSPWGCFDAVVHSTSLSASSRCPLLVDFLSLTLSRGLSRDITALSGGEALFLGLSGSARSVTVAHGARICSEDAVSRFPHLGVCAAPVTVRASLAVWVGDAEGGLPVATAVAVGSMAECDSMFWSEGFVGAKSAAGEMGDLFAEGWSKAGKGFARVVAGAMVTGGGVGVGLVGDGVVCMCAEGEMVRVSRVYRGLEGAVAVAAGLGEGMRREGEGCGERVRRRVVEVGGMAVGKAGREMAEVVGRGVGWIRVRRGKETGVVWDGGEEIGRRELRRAVKEVGEEEVASVVGREWRL